MSLAAVLVVLGFLSVVAVTNHRDERRRTQPRRDRLVRLVEARRTEVRRLDGAVADLRSQVARALRRSRTLSEAQREQAIDEARLSLAAGTVAVRGRGIRVRLTDSARTPQPGDDDGAYRIQDSDIQLVANALFAAGADAVAVNGNRLVATSAIRNAGGTIVVNFRPLAPPYEVTAVGARRSTFRTSAIARRFDRWREVFGLGFRVREADEVTVPAFSGRVRPTAAAPVGG